jgi:hypothetical protein
VVADVAVKVAVTLVGVDLWGSVAGRAARAAGPVLATTWICANSYARSVPPCLDVHVWVPGHNSETFKRFIDSYVNVDDPGDERFHAFRRVYVLGNANDTDAAALGELRIEDSDAFTLYLRARDHYGAMITVTREEATVLSLSVDDPDRRPETLRQAEQLLEQLRQQFSAPAAVAGVELPPPIDRSDWQQEAFVLLRVGDPPSSDPPQPSSNQ